MEAPPIKRIKSDAQLNNLNDDGLVSWILHVRQCMRNSQLQCGQENCRLLKERLLHLKRCVIGTCSDDLCSRLRTIFNHIRFCKLDDCISWCVTLKKTRSTPDVLPDEHIQSRLFTGNNGHMSSSVGSTIMTAGQNQQCSSAGNSYDGVQRDFNYSTPSQFNASTSAMTANFSGPSHVKAGINNGTNSELSHVKAGISNGSNGACSELLFTDQIISASQSSLSPLCFSWRTGRNVTLDMDMLFASKISNSNGNSYIVTERPLMLGETVSIQIVDILSGANGGLTFGVTSCDPSTLQLNDWPDDCYDLLDRPEYWTVRRNIYSFPNAGDKLNFQLHLDGEIRYSLNNQSSTSLMFVDTSVKLWAFWDLSGAVRAIKLLGSRISNEKGELQSASIDNSIVRKNLQGPGSVESFASGGQREQFHPVLDFGNEVFGDINRATAPHSLLDVLSEMPSSSQSGSGVAAPKASRRSKASRSSQRHTPSIQTNSSALPVSQSFVDAESITSIAPVVLSSNCGPVDRNTLAAAPSSSNISFTSNNFNQFIPMHGNSGFGDNNRLSAQNFSQFTASSVPNFYHPSHNNNTNNFNMITSQTNGIAPGRNSSLQDPFFTMLSLPLRSSATSASLSSTLDAAAPVTPFTGLQQSYQPAISNRSTIDLAQQFNPKFNFVPVPNSRFDMPPFIGCPTSERQTMMPNARPASMQPMSVLPANLTNNEFSLNTNAACAPSQATPMDSRFSVPFAMPMRPNHYAFDIPFNSAFTRLPPQSPYGGNLYISNPNNVSTLSSALMSSSLVNSSSMFSKDIAPSQTLSMPTNNMYTNSLYSDAVNQSRKKASSDSEKCKDGDECVVCMEQSPDCALYTCGHMCMCYACAQSIISSRSPLCPICQQPIKDILRIYRS